MLALLHDAIHATLEYRKQLEREGQTERAAQVFEEAGNLIEIWINLHRINENRSS